MRARMTWKAAPCENDMIPSKGPLAATNCVRASRASEKPLSQSDLSCASKLGAGLLNHQPRGSTYAKDYFFHKRSIDNNN